MFAQEAFGPCPAFEAVAVEQNSSQTRLWQQSFAMETTPLTQDLTAEDMEGPMIHAPSGLAAKPCDTEPGQSLRESQNLDCGDRIGQEFFKSSRTSQARQLL